MKTFNQKLDERKKVSTRYEVEQAIKKTLLHYYEDMYADDLFPYRAEEALTEIESKSRDGFIPYTDGGFEVDGFASLSSISGSGYYPKPKVVKGQVEDMVDYSYKLAKENFMDNNPEIVKELGEKKINYQDLYDADYGNEAEQLSEMEMEMMGDDQLLFKLGVFYYEKGNSKGDFADTADSVYVFGVINWESPYHRSGKKNEWVAKNSGSISIDANPKQFKKNLADKVKKIVSEF